MARISLSFTRLIDARCLRRATTCRRRRRFHGQAATTSRAWSVSTLTRSSCDLAGAVRDGSRQFTVAFALALGIVLLVSSRGLILDGIPVIGEFSAFPSTAGTFFDTWTSGWRPAGLGSPGPQPTAYGLLTMASYLTFGATGLLRELLIIGCIPVGAMGAWRLARPIGSARASVAAFAVYLAIPVPYNAIARGSWSGLAMYAVSPWLLLLLGRATGIAPFGRCTPSGASGRPTPFGAARCR